MSPLVESITKASHSLGFAHDELLYAMKCAADTDDESLKDTVTEYAKRTERLYEQCEELSRALHEKKSAPGADFFGDSLVVLEERSVYGSMMFFPANERAQHVCALLGMKTMPTHKVNSVKALGFTVQVQGKNPRTL